MSRKTTGGDERIEHSGEDERIEHKPRCRREMRPASVLRLWLATDMGDIQVDAAKCGGDGPVCG